MLPATASHQSKVELVLEPSANPAAPTYQKALYEQGIPLTAFAVDNIEQEATRLKQQGVRFAMEPAPMGCSSRSGE
jgi:hypothetical protein